MGPKQSQEQVQVQAQPETQPKESSYPTNGEGAFDLNNKIFLNEGNFAKAFKVTRLHDKFECVAKILKPCIAGID